MIFVNQICIFLFILFISYVSGSAVVATTSKSVSANATDISSTNATMVIMPKVTGLGMNCSQYFWDAFLASIASANDHDQQITATSSKKESDGHTVVHSEKVIETKIATTWSPPMFNF